LRQKEISFRTAKFFAVDEVDEMFSMDFAEDVRAILSRLPDERQGIFVSATISPKVEMLANNFLTNPEKIVISTPGEALPPVEHLYYEVKGEVTAKANALCDIIESYSPRSAIIFCNTKSDTELVQAFLARRGYDAEFLNSDLNQRQRDYIMTMMREGKLRLLVGTDLAARGLDIAELDLVVNYALPDQPEVYVHRTGRTGRAGRSGRAISLIGPQDFMAWVQIRRVALMEITKQELPTEEEVTTARVSHLHSLLREQAGALQPKDMLLATKFLKDAGVEAPTEDLTALVGKLCTFFIEQSASTHRKKMESVKPAGAEQDSNDARPQGDGGRRHSDSDRRGPSRSRGSDRGGRGGGYGDRRR
jgi:ATP-dependent RNA helicase DeaD